MLKEIFERNYPDFKSELSSILASKNLKTNTNPQEYAKIIIDQFKNIINFIDTELYQFLLSGAGIKFINQDFSNIRIREAFITNGIFVNTSFKNAD